MRNLRGQRSESTTPVTSKAGHDFGIIPTDPRAVEKVAGAAFQVESLSKKEKTDPISHTPTTKPFYSSSDGGVTTFKTNYRPLPLDE
jgi:hypothetical protein